LKTCLLLIKIVCTFHELKFKNNQIGTYPTILQKASL